MSRYNKARTLNNSNEYYRYLRQKRNNRKNIQHFETPMLHHPTISERSVLDTTDHIWKTGDRFYTLAHRYYGDSTYWWVLAWYNGTPTEAHLAPGDLITIPLNLAMVLSMLGA